MSDLVIMLTRYPVPGKAKTRLIPALGPEGAAQAQRTMTEHCYGVIHDGPWQAWVAYADSDDVNALRDWLGPAEYVAQAAGHLGEKLQHLAVAAHEAGYQKTIFIGSDCPAIQPVMFQQAFAALDDVDACLGPAADGGYYLLALRGYQPSVFTDITWGTEVVAEQTRTRLRDAGLSWSELPVEYDVDEISDMQHYPHVFTES